MPETLGIITQCAGHMISWRLDDEADVHRATDLIVQVADGDLALRVRDFEKGARHGFDLTLRCRRSSGAETELSKILRGCARWYLYEWVRAGKVERYVFLDMNVVRASGILERPWREIPNPDGTTWFIAIPIEELIAIGAVLSRRGEWALPPEIDPPPILEPSSPAEQIDLWAGLQETKAA